MTPVKVCVADDHPVTVQGIRQVIQTAGMEFVGSVQSTHEIVRLIDNENPMVLITEVRLGGHDALKALESIHSEGRECAVVVFTANNNPTNIARAHALGCSEFILKSSPAVSLLNAIRGAAEKRSPPETSLLVKVRSRLRRATNRNVDSPLTNRETEVLKHVAMGLSNREIAKSLGISVETVKEHVQNVLRKLDVNDRTQAAVWAIRNNLI
ncbi:MAG: response regulator transcription factor [Planctomycetota bacterium]